MSENQAIKTDLAEAIAIYDKDASVVWKALKSLAEDEYFSGNTDGQLWNKAVDLATEGEFWMRPAVSKDLILYTAILDHPKHKAALDTYGYLRGVQILLEAQAYGAAKLKEEIIRVKEIQKMQAKPHGSPGHASRHTRKYFLALLIVVLIAILLVGMGHNEKSGTYYDHEHRSMKGMPFAYQVYIVDLNKAVLGLKKFKARNPNYREGKPCVYVGSTGISVEIRLKQHICGV